MSYSRNFGMRSFENVVRDGRFRVPKTGSPLLIGAPVSIDAANPGFLRPATAAQRPSPLTGVVVFEHIQHKGVDTFLTTNVDAPFNRVPLGQYAQMVHGQGVKIWLRNTTASPLYDGRTQEGNVLYTGAVAVGDGLVPAGDGTYRVAAAGATPETPWLFVEQSNPDSGLVEARFNF
jgi:hypothetical protein